MNIDKIEEITKFNLFYFLRRKVKVKKKIIFITLIIGIIILLAIFLQNAYKKRNMGNNIISKTTEEMVETILNMKSYEAKLSVKIIRNKNEHTYVLEQKKLEDKKYRQEVLEPSNIQGTIINYEDNKLSIENTKLNLNKIYENYPYLTQNELLLDAFIQDYKTGKNSSMQEINGEIILNTEVENANKYRKYKSLTIDTKTGKPTKLEIKDVTQNILVYILYNEIKIDSLR